MGRTLLLTIALLTSFVSQAIRLDASKTCLPDVSERLEGYDSDSLVIARLGAGAMERIEGLWRFASDGGRVAIERRPLRPERPMPRYMLWWLLKALTGQCVPEPSWVISRRQPVPTPT